jgi:hypothetical protein
MGDLYETRSALAILAIERDRYLNPSYGLAMAR